MKESDRIIEAEQDEYRRETAKVFYCTDCWALNEEDCACDYDPLEDADDPRTYGLGNGGKYLM